MPARPCAASPSAPRPATPRRIKNVLRCFVALWPDPPARDELDALASRLQREHAGSRRMQGDELHLTLAFIGPLEEEPARRVADMLQRINMDPFCWTLDRCDGFDRARILWAGGQNEPRLTALAQAVRQGLDELTVGYDHKPFSAHVTLLRNVRHACALRLDTPIDWRVTQPRLVISEQDTIGKARYRTWVERSLR